MSDNTSGKGQMSQADASRIQSGQAKGGNDMSSSGFASRAQAAGDKNANAAAGGSNAKGGAKNAGGAGGQASKK